MLKIFWLISNDTFDKKPALYYILYYLVNTSTNEVTELVDEHCLDIVETSYKRVEVH